MPDRRAISPLHKGDSALERLWAALFRVCGRLRDDSEDEGAAFEYQPPTRRFRLLKASNFSRHGYKSRCTSSEKARIKAPRTRL